MSGLSVFRLFNYSTSLASFESDFVPNGDRLLQVSGARITYNTQLDVWNDRDQLYRPLERLRLYKVATSSCECSGFDPVPEYVGSALVMAGVTPAQITDDLLQNTVGEYLIQLGGDYNTTLQGCLVNDTGRVEFMDWVQTEETCPGDTYWVEEDLTCFKCPLTASVEFTNSLMAFDVISRSEDQILFESTVVNGEAFPIMLLPKKTATWIALQVTGRDDTQGTLEPGEKHTFKFSTSARELNAGTAQATVSFAVQDGGSFPGCSGADATLQVVMEVAPQPELNKPEDFQIVGYILMCIVCLTSLSFGPWVYLRREKRTVKAHQPVFLINLCAGALVLPLSILPRSLFDELDSTSSRSMVCMAMPWLITEAPEGDSDNEGVRPCNWPAIFLNLIVLVAWTAVDPLKWEIQHVPGEEWNRYESCTDLGQAGKDLLGINFGLNFVALCLTAHQAFRARNISDEFSQSRDLGFAVFTVVQIVIVDGPIYFLISKDNPDARYLLFTLIIFAISMSGLLLIFVPLVR